MWALANDDRRRRGPIALGDRWLTVVVQVRTGAKDTGYDGVREDALG